MSAPLKPIIVSPEDPVLNLVTHIKRCKDLIKTIKKEQDKYENELYKVMMEQEELQVLDEETGELRTVLTWKTDKDSLVFDAKRFQQEKLALYTEYLIIRHGSKKLLIK